MGLVWLLLQLFKWLMVGMLGFGAMLFFVFGIVTLFVDGYPPWWAMFPMSIVGAAMAFGFSQMETQ